MGLNKNQRAFFALLKAGLWEKDVSLLPLGEIDYSVVQQIAEEQSVVGLLTAGMEHIVDTKVPKAITLVFIGNALKIEERNKAMNHFVASLLGKMQEAGIRAILVKGQGVAQCYERPLWRASGDVDFLLDAENYEKSKSLLSPLATKVETEDRRILHQGMGFGQWTVELHGSMRTDISSKINAVIDEVQHDVCTNNGVRIWRNEEEEILLPNSDNDVVLVFAHFIGHFYGMGIGLRQICDWCRQLWTYRNSLDVELLESRLIRAGLMEEWKVFAAFSVIYLGMPKEAVPLYSEASKYHKKADRTCKLIIETGNLGHNREEAYRAKFSRTMVNIITFFRRLGQFARIATIFPTNSPRFFATYVKKRFKAVG